MAPATFVVTVTTAAGDLEFQAHDTDRILALRDLYAPRALGFSVRTLGWDGRELG